MPWDRMRGEIGMEFAGMSYVAIVIAAAVTFLFGGAWYGMLSHQWMGAVGKSEEELKSGPSLPVLFAKTFIALLIMAWVLAGLIGHLGAERVTLLNGAISGGFAWLGFVITTLAVNHGYQRAQPMLTVIDGGHWLLVLLIQGAIIGWMGV
jgi:hypothetical protein